MQLEVSERQLRLNQLRLIVGLMAIIFLFMLVYTIIWIVDFNKHYKQFNKTDAEVIEHKEVDNVLRDVVKYKVKGNEYILTIEEESREDVGKIITIYYDKSNPLSVVKELDNRRIILPIITTVFGCVCTGLIVVYFVIYKSYSKTNGVPKKKAQD